VVVYKSSVAGVITTLVQDTDYSVTGFPSAGTIVMTVAPVTGEQIYFVSNYQDTQLTEFESQGGFFPDVHENAFDKLTYLILQSNRNTLQLPVSFTRTSTELPAPRLNYGVKWDANGNLVEENLANNLKTDGSNAMAAPLDMGGNPIRNVGTPVNGTDALRVADLPDFIFEAGRTVLISLTENVVLTAGQTVVTLSSITTTQSAFYISGINVDNGRLLRTTDYTVDSTTQVTLAESYPAGTIITAVQNDGVDGGASGSFTTVDSKTVTVLGGVITSII
jgi:hypothetical protein